MFSENVSQALYSVAWALPAISANRTMALRFGYATQTGCRTTSEARIAWFAGQR
jgi:hypothetical protein